MTVSGLDWSDENEDCSFELHLVLTACLLSDKVRCYNAGSQITQAE